MNKADIPQGAEKGRRVAAKILEEKHPRIERVVLGQLQSNLPVIDVMVP